ncbi:SRPBCC family protein [Chitinophaga sp. Cy-1792]|uniref:SRPBCC family protein n=1 Tax=Chitinophaga sp. Cy-1792 TaxID=2608339 RepID=UPI0014207BF6|nr:SRPBCC family protein [Chitinophaga sp. Cy-1792]NIG56786.1 SRPBCC family protein [Chitinophaga sp. Cy-1792]
MTAVYILLGIVALLLLVPLFTTKDYVIRKEVIINKPVAEVYGFLMYLKNHRQFNAWLLKDPGLQTTISGTDGQVGCVLAYTGNKDVGSGELELKGLEDNKRVAVELHFLKPFKSTAETPFDLTAEDASHTRVSWTMKGHFNYPMNLALLFINMDNFLGKDVQHSLDKLKVILESR